MNRHIIFGSLALAAVAALVVACNTGMSPSSGPAGVSIYMTDAPIDLSNVHAVNVTLSGVELFPSDDNEMEDGAEDGAEDDAGESEGIEVEGGPIGMSGDLTINLLDFQNGKTTFVGSQAVPPGSFNRIRLEVVSAELVLDDDLDPATPDVTAPVTVPSSKVDVVVPFNLSADENLQITLDFDAQGSVQVNQTNGKNTYLLRPVINVSGMHS